MLTARRADLQNLRAQSSSGSTTFRAAYAKATQSPLLSITYSYLAQCLWLIARGLFKRFSCDCGLELKICVRDASGHTALQKTVSEDVFWPIILHFETLRAQSSSGSTTFQTSLSPNEAAPHGTPLLQLPWREAGSPNHHDDEVYAPSSSLHIILTVGVWALRVSGEAGS